MDAIVATAGSVAVTGTTPPPPAPTPEQVQPTESTVESGRKGSRQPFEHALFQGEGNKRGILKRLSTEELERVVETQQRESGVVEDDGQRLSAKALEAAKEILAERQAEFPPDEVDTIPVEAANVDVEPSPGSLLSLADPPDPHEVTISLPEPTEDPNPPYGDGKVTVTEFVQAGLEADTEE